MGGGRGDGHGGEGDDGDGLTLAETTIVGDLCLKVGATFVVLSRLYSNSQYDDFVMRLANSTSHNLCADCSDLFS